MQRYCARSVIEHGSARRAMAGTFLVITRRRDVANSPCFEALRRAAGWKVSPVRLKMDHICGPELPQVGAVLPSFAGTINDRR
jgi:hypothetical protein